MWEVGQTLRGRWFVRRPNPVVGAEDPSLFLDRDGTWRNNYDRSFNLTSLDDAGLSFADDAEFVGALVSAIRLQQAQGTPDIDLTFMATLDQRRQDRVSRAINIAIDKIDSARREC